MPMSSSTSSLKPGGGGHSKLSDNPKNPLNTARRPFIQSLMQSAVVFISLSLCVDSMPGPAQSIPSLSAYPAAAAERCRLKLVSVEEFSTKPESGRKQTTRFSEEEVNAYLETYLRPKYHRSLKNLRIKFEQNRLRAEAIIDFDRLASESAGLMKSVLGMLLSGTHTLIARGQLISGDGNAYFKLEWARFDDSTLPRLLIEQIITAVGKNQNPAFDPLEPTQMPYKIEKVDVLSGYIMVCQ
jgi:hypothetical protein